MKPCPRINACCEFYYYQDDSNGETAIEHCAYHEPDEEGNIFVGECTYESEQSE